jgi:hypothetical protein
MHGGLQVFSTPLVGVWVKGPSSPCHPLVAAACLKFCYSHVLLDRAMQRDASFLLLLCPEGGWAVNLGARGGWGCITAVCWSALSWGCRTC